ncbi:MAG: hypothetical protein VB876_00840 [Pirellulales bacterium]
MAFDRYMPCPGGTGKKIKFCCDDLLGELESIQKMLEGDQRLACLERVEQTLLKHPDRACLLSVKAMLHDEMQQDEARQKTLDQFLERHPDNPIALAEHAMYVAENESGPAAVEPLHKALEAIDKEIPPRVYEALLVVGRHLLAEGHFLAARAHLLFHATIGGRDDMRAMQLLLPAMRAREVPVILKDEYLLSDAPSDAKWEKQFVEARATANGGQWRLAADQLEKLAEKASDAPAIWRNLAIVTAWLADNTRAVKAWRTYAGLDISEEEAIEAAAIAQLLDRDNPGDMIELVATTYTLSDFESLSAQFAADRRTVQLPIDPSAAKQDDQPPPRGVFYLLDRNMPETGVDIRCEDAPIVYGQCYLFGRETDREPRLEFVMYKNDQFAAATDSLKRLCGSALGTVTEEKVLTEITAMQNALTWNWRLPPDTPPEHTEKLIARQREDIVLNKWPTLPNPALDGKTPEKVKDDPKYRARLAGAVLNLELSTEGDPAGDFDPLRRKLGLPLASPIDPWKADVATLPVVRLRHIDVLKLSDNDLIAAYRRAATVMATAALTKLAEEVTRRESLDDQVNKAEAFAVLASIEGTSDKAIDFLHQAQEAAKVGGESPAEYLLAEMELRIQRAEAEEFQQLLIRIRGRHIQEPGIGSALFNALKRYGIIGDDGQPVQMPPPGGEDAEAMLASGADSVESSEIWTPDTAAATGGKKSAIWTPDD